jgi:hypothetical protein
LTDSVAGFLRDKRYLIHDRDPLFTEAFRATLRAAGIKCLKLPARSPNLNAVAERFVLSIKSECRGSATRHNGGIRARRPVDLDRAAGPQFRSGRLEVYGSTRSARIDIWHQTR